MVMFVKCKSDSSMKRVIMTICLMAAGVAALMAQQTRDVKGVVTDKKGVPVVGAEVLVEGTTISTITDLDGNFLLREVPVEAGKVIVTSVGMNTEEIDINSPIMLASRPRKLSLVVEAGLDGSRYTVNSGNALMGYHVGVGLEVRRSKRWAFRPMLQLASRGTEYVYSDERYEFKETWKPLVLDMPLNFLLRYGLGSRMNLVFSFGPVLSWGLSGKVTYGGTGVEEKEYEIFKKVHPSDWGGPDHALLHRFGTGLTYGVGVEYKKLLVGVVGKSMLIMTEDDGINTAEEHNFVLGASVSYRF